jgi:hypothetical protein
LGAVGWGGGGGGGGGEDRFLERYPPNINFLENRAF